MNSRIKRGTSIFLSFDTSNLEDDRPPLSATIASHAGNRDLQNGEMAQDGEKMPNIEELIFDLSEKDLDTLESRSILTNFYLERGQHSIKRRSSCFNRRLRRIDVVWVTSILLF